MIDVPARLILSLAEVYVKRSKAIYASVAKRSNFLPNDLPKLTSVWRWPVCVSITDEYRSYCLLIIVNALQAPNRQSVWMKF